MKLTFSAFRAVALVALLSFCSAPAATDSIDLPGVRPDGSVLLPNQWILRPAGRQVELGNFPVNIAVHPRGQFAAVLHSGYGRHEIVVVNIKKAAVVSRRSVHETFYGLAFSRDGRHLYCSGGGDEVVHVFDFQHGVLSDDQTVRVHGAAQRGVPCGLAVSQDENRLFTANLWGQRVSELDLAAKTNVADIAFGAVDELAHNFTKSGEISPDLAAVTKRMAASLDPTAPDAPFPYDCALDEARHRLYVSLWARSCVAVVNLDSRTVVARWTTQEHPNELLLSRSGRYLYVANGNRNTVTAFDTASGATVATLDSSLSPNSAAVPPARADFLPDVPGSTPNSVALTPDNTKLFVANADNNDVAVFDVSDPAHSRALGFIPVGKYPTSVRVTPDGRRLLVANGKGIAPLANPAGPQPGQRAEGKAQYIADLVPGTLSIINLPRGDEDWKAALTTYTRQAYENVPRNAAAARPASPDNPIPQVPGQISPLKYCIYIIKENRTYDQVLGDLPQGNGDAHLCLFPEKVSPNHHKLAREFVLFDNFYVDAEVSAGGHEWSTAAYSSDFVEKNWPLSYGHNQAEKYPYPAEGNFPAAYPASGYIWDDAKDAGVSYRSYGEFVGELNHGLNVTRMPGLQGHIDPLYHGFDIGYPDVKRAERFISELHRYETESDMPRLQIVRLPNDHTAGGSAGALSPTALVGDNDLALGQLVEAVSHSKFWPQTAIFALEDDAQNGPDHVDAHRSVLLVASPYAHHGKVDSTMYSTSSVLRTMELILGLKPMTQFDAAAMPMFNAFDAAPNPAAYDAAPAGADLEQRNPRNTAAARESSGMDFSREDAVDDFALNHAVWQAVRGDRAVMPAPVHAAFIFAPPKNKDKDGDDD